MSDYFDINYQIQDAVERYLQANLATYMNGLASTLPIVKAGEFADRGRNHIWIVMGELTENPELTGDMMGDLVVGVATLKETSIDEHRQFCKAVLNLMMEMDLAAYINAAGVNKVRINKVGRHQVAIGVLTDSLRFTQVSRELMVYMEP